MGWAAWCRRGRSGTGEFVLVRVQATERSVGTKASRRVAGLADCENRLQVVDLETGAEKTLNTTVGGPVLNGYEITGRDVALVLQS
jgi:hypothetical protein